MDFSNRGSQQSPAAPRPSSAFPTENNGAKAPVRGPKLDGKNKWFKWGAGALLVAVAVLILALLAMSLLSSGSKNESSYVDNSKLQAVFLTNNQVYFGKISQLGDKVLVLNNIYYLRTDSGSNSNDTSANSNVSLVKLGCELHKPYDKMVINRDQVQFWENLQADGQVANAVKQYQSSNPQNNCSNSTSGATSGSNVQGTTPSNTNTGTSNNTPTTKP